MRDVEFQAMVEAMTPVREWQPTDAELHQLFWGEHNDLEESVPTLLPEPPRRTNNVLTADQAHLAQELAWRDYEARRHAAAQRFVTGEEPPLVVPEPVRPERPRDWWKAHAYWVQLCPDGYGGKTWYDVEGLGYSQSRDGAQALLDRLHRAQPQLALRIAEPQP